MSKDLTSATLVGFSMGGGEVARCLSRQMIPSHSQKHNYSRAAAENIRGAKLIECDGTA